MCDRYFSHTLSSSSRYSRLKHTFCIPRKVREKIQNALASKFGIVPNKVYLTKPTFFSRLTNKPPLSSNDEYWHSHIDKVKYYFVLYISRIVVYMVDLFLGNISLVSLHYITLLERLRNRFFWWPV